ncbi:MAG: glycosyltransferase [Pseudomonadota bacterium]
MAEEPAPITQSNSWKPTKPLGGKRTWMTKPGYQARQRYVRSILGLTKRCYQALPFSLRTRAKHWNLLAKFFPKLLLFSGSHPSTIPVLSVPGTILSALVVDPSQYVHSPDTSIILPTSANPLVSVIMPIHGKMEYTLLCLDSIAKNPPGVLFEVIVVDDCSPDNSIEALRQVQGIHLIQNTENLGFIRSCNRGAQAANGEYLLLLNNDTQVTAGWMDELLRTFHEFPGTGLAGSKLVNPDGRLQEAGGIIWQDGSAWNFGRLQDPSLPVYNYAREVDYCSGASIMIPKSLFAELGGFDERYVPAYCEDSDLALKVRDRGYRVIYQPLSAVIHFEGTTSGSDITQGVKAYQPVNTRKQFERWAQRLRTHQEPGKDVDAAKDRCASRRVLFLDHCVSTPDQDAGSVTAFNSMLLLREMGFQVTFIPEDNFLYDPKYTGGLQRAGIEVLYAPYVTSVEQHLREYGQRYDLAMLFRPRVVNRHYQCIRTYCGKAKILYHTMDLHFLRMTREAELQGDKSKQRAADEMKDLELSAIRAVDAAIVHSTAEFDLLRPLLPDARIHVFPLILNVKDGGPPFSERRNIVFIGGYQHTPNVDAVKYFAMEIMPLLRKRIPGIVFYAVGSKPPREINALASEDVVITGFVEELTPMLNAMRLSVAPLRYGAGIKGKIGTAMAVGLPVVATSLAAEGMSLTDGENIVVADGAEAFADAICRVYQDESLWTRISRNGVEFADRAWGAEAAWKVFAGILADLDLDVSRGRHPLSLYSDCMITPPSSMRRL